MRSEKHKNPNMQPAFLSRHVPNAEAKTIKHKMPREKKQTIQTEPQSDLDTKACTQRP